MLTEALLYIASGRLFHKVDATLQDALLTYVTWQVLCTPKTT